MNTKFKITSNRIVDILINKSILIPIYQRNYSWKEEHVLALIEDLIAREKDNSKHYFGVIALTATTTRGENGSDKVINKVIDGQQRLTTSLLLFHYLARRVKEIDHDSYSLFNVSKSSLDFSYEMSNTTLSDNIRNLNMGNYNLLKGSFKVNYEVIKNELNQYDDSYISKLFETFRDNFIVAVLDYTIEREEEMIVFENLNSKGSPLKPFDLIRNYILSMSVVEPQVCLKLFNEYIMNLMNSEYKSIAKSDSKKEDKIQRFIEHYLIFKSGDSLKKYLNYSEYKNFKDFFRLKKKLTESELKDFLGDMRKYAILYLSIMTKKNIGNNIWLKTLSMNKDNHIFLFFSIFKKYSVFNEVANQWEITKEVEQFAKVVVVHVMKTMSVMGTGQSFTKMYVDVMKKIVSNNSTPSELKKMFENGDIKGTNQTPSDTEFTQSLLLSPKQKWMPGSFINILEQIAFDKNSAKEKIDYVEKSLEHIMPQKPKKSDWPIVFENDDEFKHKLNLIGNLANFNKSANSKLGNKSFESKKKIYKDSNSPLVKGTYFNLKPLYDIKSFTFDIILKRTEKLITEIIKEFNKL